MSVPAFGQRFSDLAVQVSDDALRCREPDDDAAFAHFPAEFGQAHIADEADDTVMDFEAEPGHVDAIDDDGLGELGFLNSLSQGLLS